MNIAPDPLATNNAAITKAMRKAALRAGEATLPERLAQLSPRKIWVATKLVAKFALKVIER